MRPLQPVLAAAFLLSACASAPAPLLRAAAPAHFSQSGTGPAALNADWWSVFNDPMLSDLVTRALNSNLDVRTAASRVRQARLQAAVVRGGQGPQVNASASASRARLSENALPSALANIGAAGAGGGQTGGGVGLAGESISTYQLGFDASWELDLAGGQAAANRAAASRIGAAVWTQRDAQVRLAAEVANTYQQVRTLQRRIALNDQMLAVQTQARDLAQARSRNGVANTVDDQRRIQALAQSTAQGRGLFAQQDAARHALAVLLDLNPADLDAALAGAPPPAPAALNVPPGLPSELLQRRPDIRTAQSRYEAAAADAGVAAADLYPKITLTGALSVASRSLSSLLDSGSLQDNAGARLSAPIFDRGRLRANAALRREQAQEAQLAYSKTVLTGLGEVEDGLSRLAADRDRRDSLAAAVAAAQDAADSAAARARNGLTGETETLDARLAALMAQDALVQAQGLFAQDAAALFKALGGGWTASDKKDSQGG